MPAEKTVGPAEVRAVLAAFRRQVRRLERPSVNQLAGPDSDPFRVLVSTMISLRTKDEVTLAASRRLLARAGDPAALAGLEAREIEKLIYPAGFYRVKAGALKAAAGRLLEKHDGRVPHGLDELLALPGVGRKTANLVLGLAFGLPAICVDTHVHRISNRLGWVVTGSPEETEKALAAVVPRGLWIELNTLMVAYGKNVCTPTSPRCSICGAFEHCRRIGVDRKR